MEAAGPAWLIRSAFLFHRPGLAWFPPEVLELPPVFRQARPRVATDAFACPFASLGLGPAAGAIAEGSPPPVRYAKSSPARPRGSAESLQPL